MIRKILTGILSLGLMLYPMNVLAEEPQDDSIVIYHTNDTHGYLESGDISISRVAGIKQQQPNAILVDAGDATQGLPMASMTKGKDVIDLMNMAGYDVMALGNHEFDFGVETLIQNAQAANFPMLAANVTKDGKKLLEGVQEGNAGCHTIIERDGKKIGFFGLVTTQTATATNPTGIQGVSFQDEIESAKHEIDELDAEQVDAIVAIAHLGDGDAPCTAKALAQAMDGEYKDKVTAIIDGHSHTVENEKVNGIQIVQTGYGLNAIGELTLNFEEGEVTTEERLLHAEDVKDIPVDQSVETRMSELSASYEELLKEPVGTTPVTLWAGWINDIAMTRIVETNYGDLACDAFIQAGTAMVQSTGTSEEKQLPVIAVENGGGIREAVSNGTITKGNLISTFPFSNTLYMKKITPKTLYAMMETSGSLLAGQDPNTGMLLQEKISGGFLQVGGFQVVFDPDGKENAKVVSIRLLDQKDILDRNDDTTQLLLVSNNFIMSGGNDYTMLADIEKYGEAGGELETIQAYIESCLIDGFLTGYTSSQNRISYTGSVYQPKDYEVSIQIMDEQGSLMKHQKLSYQIDGGKRINGETNEEGILIIKVSDGAHGIRLGTDQKEIYVDNYTGIGVKEDAMRQLPVLQFLKDGSCDPVILPVEEEEEQPQKEPEKEKPQTTPQPNNKPQTDKKHPNTGDQSDTALWAGCLLLSAGLAIKVVKQSKMTD